MDQPTSDAIQAVAYSLGAVGSLTAIAVYYTNKIKTAAERLQAKTEHLMTIKDVLGDPNYKIWLEKRVGFAEDIIKEHPAIGDSENNSPEEFEKTLDAVVGKDPFRNLKHD